MKHRYQAPEHSSAVFTATGEHRAENGVITLAAGAPASDHAALRAAGCAAIGDKTAKAPPASELGALRAEFKQLTAKNPSPRLDADALGARLAELKAEQAKA